MKIAYMIQAHKNFEQISLLVDSLTYNGNGVFIHIDKKNDNLYNDLKKKYINYENVSVIDERVSVNWSGLSQVEAAIKLMESVENSRIKYDYVSFISGQDYPIKNNQYIEKYLTLNNGRNFIEFDEIGKYEWRLKRYSFFTESPNNRKTYMRVLDKSVRSLQSIFMKRKNLIGMDLYIGSQWFTIQYDCMIYMLEFIRANNGKYFKDFKHTACPDEHFFQTIVMNSKYKDSVINDNLRFIDWSDGLSSPKTLTESDINRLLESNKLIARKFDIDVDREVVLSLRNTLYKG